MNKHMPICYNCNSVDHRVYALAKDRHYGNVGIFTFLRCSSCSLVFLEPMPSDKTLSTYYPQTFYAYQEYVENGRFHKLMKSLLLMNFFTKDPSFKSNGKLLDLGCGSGEFMHHWKQKGWEVYGVEPSKQAAEHGRNHKHLNIFNGTLLEANFIDAQFDYVRSNHSFEHINNPNETLKEIFRILKKDGRLLIAVPNIDGVFAKLFKNYWWYLGAPVHTFNYSVNTLTNMAAKHGFEVVRVVHNGNFTGILGSIQIWLNRNSAKTSQEGFTFNFKPARLICQWLAKCTNLLRMSDAIEVTFVKKY